MTHRAFLPFIFLPSRTVTDALGRRAERAAVLAFRAIMKTHRQLEVAHQQIRYGDHHLAFSSRITGAGELVVELDIGDPRLEDRLVLEDAFREAGRQARGIARDGRRRVG
jgi:hypothetical protein